MINKLMSYFPPPDEYDYYVEAYAGSGVVLFSKPRSSVEIYNDLNFNVYSLHMVLQDAQMFAAFRQRAETALYIEELSNEYQRSLKEDWRMSPAEKAFRYWYVNRTRVNGIGGFSINPTIRRSMAKSTSDFLATVEGLNWIHQRLQPVIITNRDALGLIAAWDRPRTFLYLDPPYMQETRTETRYEVDADDDHHHKLIEILRNFKHAKVVLSGYRTALYDSLGWENESFDVNSVANNEAKLKTETVWMSFAKPKMF